MAYEKPELVTLGLARPVVRSFQGADEIGFRKVSGIFELGVIQADAGNGKDGNGSRTDSTETSSTGGAYEADE